MRCPKCKKKNVTQATYCISCGHEFTKKEKETGIKKNVFAKIYRSKEKIDFLTLGTLKDKWYIRVLSLLLSIGGGFYLYFINGNTMKILKSEDYSIEHKKNSNEYLIITKKEEIPLNLYFPTTPKKISIDCFNKEKDKLSSKEYNDNKNIILSIKEKPYYCEIKMDSKNKVILYPKKEVE